MAPVRKSGNKSDSKSKNLTGTSSTVAETPRIIDLNDARNFAAERPVRSSRNSAPTYARPLLHEAKTGRTVKTKTERGSAAQQEAKKERIRPKQLTPRKQELIWNFLSQAKSNPGQFGPVGGDHWMQELIRILGPPKKGKQSIAQVTVLDVDDWLKDAQFAELLRKILNDESSTSTGSNESIGIQPDSSSASESNNAQPSAATSTTEAGTSSSVSPASTVGPSSPNTGLVQKSKNSSFPKPSGSAQFLQTDGNDDYDEGKAAAMSDDDQPQVISIFERDPSQTKSIARARSFAGQYPPVSNFYDGANNGYEMQTLGELNRIQTQPAHRVSVIRGPTHAGYLHQPWIDRKTIVKEETQTESGVGNSGTSAFVAYPQVVDGQTSHANPVSVIPSDATTGGMVVTYVPVPSAAVRELTDHSGKMVQIYNKAENAGYANNPGMAVFRHQLNAMQDVLYYFMGGNEQEQQKQQSQ